MKALLMAFWLILLSANLRAGEIRKFDYNEYKKIECLKEVQKLIGLESERVFNIEGCSEEVIERDLTRFLLMSSGYQFEWFSKDQSSPDKAIMLLEEDHRMSDGDAPFKHEQIQKIISFAKNQQSLDSIEVGEFADSYMSGTGITGLVVLYNATRSRLVLIQKFIYAE